jgi:hypothetical protein
MDLEDLIKTLQKQRSALDEVIVSLAAMRSSLIEGRAAAAKKRRGRKSMGMGERQVVAERMKQYWATMSMGERRVIAERVSNYWAMRRQAKLARDPGSG